MELSKTKRDAPKLLHGGFSYSTDKTVNDQIYWRCEKRDHCRGRMITNFCCTEIKKMPYNHSHPPDAIRTVAIKTVAAIKERASTSEEPTRSVINNCILDVPLSAAAALPRKDHLESRPNGSPKKKSHR